MPFTLIKVPKVEDEVVCMLPDTSRETCGLVNPMPMYPSPDILMASVSSVPDRRVEKIKEPVALEKFWLRSPVMAAVVVGKEEPLLSSALKEMRLPVLVAFDRLETYSGSVVIPPPWVLTTSSLAWGIWVPMPTLPFEVVSMEKMEATFDEVAML